MFCSHRALMLQALSVCGDCFELTGPANTTISFFDYGANTTTTYQLQLSWDPAYLGPITLAIVPPVRCVIIPARRICLLLCVSDLARIWQGLLWFALRAC